MTAWIFLRSLFAWRGIANHREETLKEADGMADCAYTEGYLQALLDTGTVEREEPVPPRFDAALDQHQAKRRDRRTRA